ncbi:MAG: hypothetical protein R6V04_08275 [bacterium]
MKRIIFITLAFLVFCSHKQYQIKYVDTAFDTSNISRIAIFDFENKTDIDLLGSYASERLQYYLKKESEFITIEQKKIKQAVEELHLGDQSWMNDQQKIKEIGKYLAIDALIIGAVIGIDDSHSQYYYTKEFDTSFETSIQIIDVVNAGILYSNNCRSGNEDMTIHHENPQFMQKRIARQLIDQCVQILSSEFLPKKIKIQLH